jgi:hypothetical protein
MELVEISDADFSAFLDTHLFSEEELASFNDPAVFDLEEAPCVSNLEEVPCAFNLEEAPCGHENVCLFEDPVAAVRQRLYSLAPGELLQNTDLESIAHRIDLFTYEEFEKIPNIYIRGETHYPQQFACEMAVTLKTISKTWGLDIKALMLPYLTSSHCKCYCEKKDNGQQCTRKRRWGCFSCSRHKDAAMDSLEYAKKMHLVP